VARGDALFARIEVEFILNDPRFFTLSDYCQTLYLGLWCIAVKERKERLDPWYTPASIAQALHKDPRSIASGLTKLQQACLISIDDDGCVIVRGVGSKHKKMQGWRLHGDSPYGDDTGPITSPKKRKRKRKSEEVDTQAPPTGHAEYPIEFEGFWQIYPRKLAKKDALAKWTATLKKGASVDVLFMAAKNYARAMELAETEQPYIKHAATFLGPKEHWREFAEKTEEEIKAQFSKKTGGRKPGTSGAENLQGRKFGQVGTTINLDEE